MKKNKIPPDNTGKKYLTELTPKQRKLLMFIALNMEKLQEQLAQ